MINDRFGHLQGDEVLGSIGRLFKTHVRDTDVVCRYGGDEFVILLPETDLPMAVKTARKLLEQLQLLVFHGPQLPDAGIHLTASLGVSALRPDQKEADLLLAADTAVYRAKQLGRNRVEVF
jgi:diguanylate cyclase (GGDEF)-like protein